MEIGLKEIPPEVSEVLKDGIIVSNFVCPIKKQLDDCTFECEHFDVCEGWKDIAFKLVEESCGALVRGFFLK